MTKSREPATMNDIEIIPGNINILLIAPHGHDEDDKNTGKLVRHVAKHCGCYAIINEFYWKPDNQNDDESADKKARRINLNRIAQVETHLNKEFLEPLLKYKNEIIKRFGNALLLWVHGAYDDSVVEDVNPGSDIKPKKVKVLIGYGQHQNDNRYTGKPATVHTLKKELNVSGLTAVPANTAHNNFCAWDIHNMNQYFQLQKIGLDEVQSIQLEFRMKGCRNNEKNIKSTAESIARAISSFVQPEVKATSTKNKITDKAQEKRMDSTKKTDNATDKIPAQENAPVQKMSDTDDREDAIEVGEEVIKTPGNENALIKARPGPDIIKEDPLVEEAYSYLYSVFSKHYGDAMMEAGRYIIKTFYGNDIYNAKANKPTHEKTLNQLYDKIKENSNPNSPSKSKLYHAKNLIVQEHDLKKYLSKESFSTFRNLSLSHKMYLLSIRNIFRKKGLIEQVALEQLSVRGLQGKIKKDSRSNAPTPLQLINNPQKIWEGQNSNLINYDNLLNHSSKELKKYQEALISKKETYEKYLKEFNDIEKELKKAIETNKEKPEKAFGFQEWIKHSVNISTGCPNDCKYCFAKAAAYRRKQVEKGQWGNEKPPNKDVKKKQKRYDGVVGFPTSHDITPSNVEEYIKVLEKLLSFGNEVLIVSKPNFECIKKICKVGSKYKDKILFRFSIGAMDSEILSFWETNAPPYAKRKESLKYTFDKGFKTSVSMEPLLDSANVVSAVSDIVNYITDSIWIGKMNYTEGLWDEALKNDDENLLKHLEAIESGQTDDKVKSVYAEFQEHPKLLEKIKWKDSYKEVLEKHKLI